MNVQDWLGAVSKQRFVAEYFHRLPYASTGGGGAFCELGGWASLGAILVQPEVDVMVVRRGERYGGQLPRSGDDAQRLCEEGYTILVRHAERHDVRLADLAGGFARDFGGHVNIHIYATPGKTFGFGWHYDAEDVFILQTTGVKEYSLRKNTVNPWPLEEMLPENMRYEREIMPLMRCLLSAGDWLYIPCGYWHMGEAAGDDVAISLAVGVMSPAAITVLDRLRSRLVSSLLWRQKLPVHGAAAPTDMEAVRESYRQLLSSLADDLRRQLADESFLDEFLRDG